MKRKLDFYEAVGKVIGAGNTFPKRKGGIYIYIYIYIYIIYNYLHIYIYIYIYIITPALTSNMICEFCCLF